MEKRINHPAWALLLSIYILAAVSLTFCKQSGRAHVEVTASGADSLGNNDSMTGESLEVGSPEKNAFVEFGASKDGAVARLRDWRKDLKMSAFGNLKDTTMQVLGVGADTHIGASIQTYHYDDIKMDFYGPKNGTDHWLVRMELTGPEWSTARGIHVGDSVEDLLTLYPKASNETTGDKNLYRYEVDESTIEFTTKDNRVSKIEIRYNIP